MKKAVIYIHGKGGSPTEAEHYKPLFEDCDVIGLDYKSETPWDARDEFPRLIGRIAEKYDSLTLIANSIGAFFAMHSLAGQPIEKAFFVSPIVDMEKLITDMMLWANVTENELCERGEIPTSFGETLSWDYLTYVRQNPIEWRTPTAILYGERDDLTSYATVSSFAERTGASLTVMPDGEHWFHTVEEMAFLDEWVKMNR